MIGELELQHACANRKGAAGNQAPIYLWKYNNRRRIIKSRPAPPPSFRLSFNFHLVAEFSINGPIIISVKMPVVPWLDV